MATYIDTCVLVKLYCPEPDSAKAVSAIQKCSLPIVFTVWQSLELRNALRLKVFRKELPAEGLNRILGRIDQDTADGVLLPLTIDHELVFAAAEKLSDACTIRNGCRTLDIIHVAAAQVLQVKRFITFDLRQMRIAKSAGFRS